MSNSADISLVRKAIINYTLVKGDDFAPLPVSFTIDGTPEDFTGSTLKMQVRTDKKRLLIELNIGSGINVSTNILQYNIAAADMEEWATGVYKYDVQKTFSSIIQTIQGGTITLIEEITA